MEFSFSRHIYSKVYEVLLQFNKAEVGWQTWEWIISNIDYLSAEDAATLWRRHSFHSCNITCDK